jgi:hypothetical protein
VRRAAILALAIALAACTSSAPISTPSPLRSDQAAVARATPQPCVAGATQVGAFAKTLAESLSALHPLVQEKAFDGPATLGAIRAATSSLTPYVGVETTLAQCPDGASLAAEVVDVRTAVSDSARPALSALLSDSQTIRDGAVAEFNLLPRVLKLGRDAAALALAYDTGVALAELPQGSADPLGTLPPLATPTPPPTPRPAPHATQAPAVITSGGSSVASSNYQTVQKYLASVQLTYQLVYSTVSNLWGLGTTPAPGVTPAEIAANQAEARSVFGPTVKEINAHLNFIATHPLRCLGDGYSVDKPLVSAWKAAFQSYDYPGDATPEELKAAADWQDRLNATDNFIRNLSRYIADC